MTDFKKFVDEYNPGFIVIENVPGILTKDESPLNDFLDFLKAKTIITTKQLSTHISMEFRKPEEDFY